MLIGTPLSSGEREEDSWTGNRLGLRQVRQLLQKHGREWIQAILLVCEGIISARYLVMLTVSLEVVDQVLSSRMSAILSQQATPHLAENW